MKEIKLKMTDPAGLHAQLAAVLVKTASGYQSTIKLSKGIKSADAKKVFAVMSLGIMQGEEAYLTIQGPDEKEAAAELQQLVKEKF